MKSEEKRKATHSLFFWKSDENNMKGINMTVSSC